VSVVIRLPEEMVREVRTYAAIRGQTWQELLTDAWSAYKARHANEWARALRAEADRLEER
jgi:hypothetical protein